jgi:hypothetical protein
LCLVNTVSILPPTRLGTVRKPRTWFSTHQINRSLPLTPPPSSLLSSSDNRRTPSHSPPCRPHHLSSRRTSTARGRLWIGQDGRRLPHRLPLPTMEPLYPRLHHLDLALDPPRTRRTQAQPTSLLPLTTSVLADPDRLLHPHHPGHRESPHPHPHSPPHPPSTSPMSSPPLSRLFPPLLRHRSRCGITTPRRSRGWRPSK